MANLFDMQCPECGDADLIDIAATVWVRVTRDGTDPDLAEDGQHEFSPASPAQCHACHYTGQVADFLPREIDGYRVILERIVSGAPLQDDEIAQICRKYLGLPEDDTE